MLFLIFVFTMFCGIFFKKFKFYWLVCFLLLSLLVVTTKKYADFSNYEYIFNYYNKGNISLIFSENGPILWNLLCYLIGKIGFSYRGMVLIVIFTSMWLINYRIKDININNNIFWSLFILFPGIIQCVQLRFFLAISIIFFGLIPLLMEKKGSLIKYIICIIISYLVHSSCLIFIIFIFLPLFDKIGYKKTLAISVAFTLILYFAFQKIIPQIASHLISTIKFNRYFNSNVTQTTTVRFIKIFFVWFLCNFTNILILKKLNNVLYNNDNLYVLVNNIQKAISILVITTFFLVFDANFHRFIQIAYILFFINISLFYNYVSISKIKKLSFLIIIIMILNFAYYIYTPYDTVTKPFFTFDGVYTILK